MHNQYENKSKKGHTYRQWFIAITANLTLLTYGMQAGWVSPTMKTLQSGDSPTGLPLTDNEMSWVGSVLGLSAAAGVSVYSYLADKYGRKFCIFAIAGPQALGWMIKFSSANTSTIIIARVFCGFAAGGCFATVPVYVKEISQDNIRGLVGSLLIMIQNIGFLAIYAIGAYFKYFTVLWIVVWLPIIAMILMVKAPESPPYLIKVGKADEAATAIAFLRGLDKNDDSVQKEVECLRKEDLYFKSLPNVSFLSIFKEKTWRCCFLLMVGIITIHASNGSFAIVTYASSILASSGTGLDPNLQSLTFPSVMILAAFASMSCVERFGRKPVLAVGQVLIITSMLCVAAVVFVQSRGGSAPGWLPLTAMVVNMAAYAFGLSPVPFIMMSEIFNFQIRAKAIGAVVTYSWFLSFVQLLVFSPLSNAAGLHGAFFFYSFVNAIGLFISVALLPETRGKTVEQIELELRSKYALKST